MNPETQTKDRKHKMKTYKITATIIDNNGVRVWSSNAETLGEYFGRTFATRAEAEEAAENLSDEGLATAEYSVEEA